MRYCASHARSNYESAMHRCCAPLARRVSPKIVTILLATAATAGTM